MGLVPGYRYLDAASLIQQVHRKLYTQGLKEQKQQTDGTGRLVGTSSMSTTATISQFETLSKSAQRVTNNLFGSSSTTTRTKRPRPPSRPPMLPKDDDDNDNDKDKGDDNNNNNNNNNRNKREDKFSMTQRIESVKCVVVGALSGGIAVTPVSYLHAIIWSQSNQALAQWEYWTDMSSLQAALFAIVYRYAIRDDTNPMLNQGVIGAFVIARTMTSIQVSDSCTAIPLTCGSPLGYFDWSMISQALVVGGESAVLFTAAAAAMDYCLERGWISKFNK